MLGVIWYPKRIHSELVIGDQVRYYIGNKDRYNFQKRIKDLSSDHQASIYVMMHFPTGDLTVEQIENIIKQTNISPYNTCMGTVAFLIHRLCRIKIPPFIRLSPELSYLYILVRSSRCNDVQIEYMGITKKEAMLEAIKNGSCHLVVIGFFTKIVAGAIRGLFETNLLFRNIND